MKRVLGSTHVARTPSGAFKLAMSSRYIHPGVLLITAYYPGGALGQIGGVVERLGTLLLCSISACFHQPHVSDVCVANAWTCKYTN